MQKKFCKLNLKLTFVQANADIKKYIKMHTIYRWFAINL